MFQRFDSNKNNYLGGQKVTSDLNLAGRVAWSTSEFNERATTQSLGWWQPPLYSKPTPIPSTMGIREGTGSLKVSVISPSLWVTQSLPHPAQPGSCSQGVSGGQVGKKQGDREIWPSQLKWNFCKLFPFTYFSSVMRVIFGARRSQKDAFVLSATKHRGNRKTSERTFTFKMFGVI